MSASMVIMDIPSAAQIKEQAIRAAIAQLMEVCTESERQFLHTIHDHAPWKGLVYCPAVKLDETYELLRRTVQTHAKEMTT